MKSPHIINCGFDTFVCLRPLHTSAQSHSSFRCTIASSLDSLVVSSSSPAQRRDLLLDPSPSSRTQAYLLASISTAYLRSQFIEDSHDPARKPFRSAQHVSEVSPRTPVRLLRARARPTNRIGIPTRPFSHASRSFRLRSDTRPDSRHHDTDEFPFQASAPSTS